jgi:integrase
LIWQLTTARLDAFFAELSSHLQPVSLRVVCNSLRSYFRYRALLGEKTETLAAALPRIADWRHTTLPKALSEVELEAFMNAFDRVDPVGLRDYAIARCLVDLGLRGHEVTYLTMESVSWRNATLTICGTKSKRVQQLPLPISTGSAIAEYLCQGRPQTENRALFVRHRAPFDKPLGVPAMHLLQAGVDITVIALWLGHESPVTTHGYIEADLEMKERALATIAPPETKQKRYRPSDALLKFLESL